MSRRLLIGSFSALLLVATGCGDNSPTRPSENRTPLAGGGRLQGDDPFRGGPGYSGPENPVFDSVTGLVPLFYADVGCAASPAQRIITNADEWNTWWEAANSCLWRGPMGPDSSHGPNRPFIRVDSIWSDSGTVDSIIVDTVVIDTVIIDTLPCGRCIPDPPEIDFARYVVVVISLPADSGSWCGRNVWVQEIETSGSGTIIRYGVLELGEDCCALMMRPMALGGNSPTVAVLASRPIAEPITWERTDLKQDCKWGPDPNAPQTLYYTDAPCDLGSSETVITDSARFAEWIKTAAACDSIRWYEPWPRPDDPSMPPGDSVMPHDPDPRDSVGLSDPMPMLPWWGGLAVDFSTHAVIILRAGETTRWGGGVWLDNIETTSSGTVIDYSVIMPSDSCPPVDDNLSVLNPTVAIQVPLPLAAPVTWNRRVETIDCDWGTDTSWVGIDSLRPR